MYYLTWSSPLSGCAYPDILEGYDGAEKNNRTLFAQLDALADLKFTYVISFQMFGSQKSSGDPHAQDILDLMTRYYFTKKQIKYSQTESINSSDFDHTIITWRYPSVRVAYVEEKEEIVEDIPQKVYSSILVKAVDDLDQVVTYSDCITTCCED